MKYTVQIDIDLPREHVIELFEDPDNLVKWQKGLLSFEHLIGEPGQLGAKARLVFKFGNGKMEMIMKGMGFFMKSAFPKQSMVFLLAFKSFAENGTDVRLSG